MTGVYWNEYIMVSLRDTLPIEQQITYKIEMTAFSSVVLHVQRTWLKQLLDVQALVTSSFQLRTRSRSLCFAAWNSLLLNLRNIVID